MPTASADTTTENSGTAQIARPWPLLRWQAALGLVITALFWNGNTLVARINSGSIPALELNFWRWTLAAALMLPFTLRTLWRHRMEIGRHFPYVLVQSLLSVVLYNSLLYKAAQTTSGISITFINSAAPIGTFLFSWLLLRQLPRANQLLGVGLALTGVLAIVGHGGATGLRGEAFTAGDLWIACGTLCWCLYSVLLMRSPLTLSTLPFISLTASLGVLLMIPLVVAERQLVGGFEPTPERLASIGYIAIFPSIVAFYFWNRGVSYFGPNKAALFLYLMPCFAALFGTVLMGESLTGYHVVGELFIAGGFVCGVLLPDWISARRRRLAEAGASQ